MSTITTRIVNKGAPLRVLAGAELKALHGVSRAIKIEVLSLLAYIKVNKLSDQILHVRTGRLRRSITARFEDNGATYSKGIIGTNVSYARAHEEGVNKTVSVKAHTRVISQAFGKPISPREVNVRAHPMKMNLPARPFMRTSLEENKPRIMTNIRKALGEAIK